jgi:hypothetical protein
MISHHDPYGCGFQVFFPLISGLMGYRVEVAVLGAGTTVVVHATSGAITQRDQTQRTLGEALMEVEAADLDALAAQIPTLAGDRVECDSVRSGRYQFKSRPEMASPNVASRLWGAKFSKFVAETMCA